MTSGESLTEQNPHTTKTTDSLECLWNNSERNDEKFLTKKQISNPIGVRRWLSIDLMRKELIFSNFGFGYSSTPESYQRFFSRSFTAIK